MQNNSQEAQLTYFAKSKDGLWFKFGTQKETAKWFSVSDKVRGFVEKLAPNTPVTIKFVEVNGKPNILFLTKGNAPLPAYTGKNGASAGGARTYVPRNTAQPIQVLETNSTPPGMKNADTREEMIIKQTVLKAASTAVASLTGVFSSVEEVVSAVKHTFKELLPLVTSMSVVGNVEVSAPGTSEPQELEEVPVE